MDWKKLFPFAAKAKDVTSLLVALVIYLVAPTVVGFVLGLLGWIPVLGMLLGLVSWAFGIYCFIGVILTILAFLKVIK